MKIQNNYSLKKLNTFAVDVNTKYYIETSNIEVIKELINNKFLEKNNFFILGNGSNTLFRKNYDGIIIRYTANNIKIEKTSDKISCIVDAGMIWDDFIQITIKNNIIGFENLANIPSTVGAAAVQNIGAYGQEQSNYFDYLVAINLLNGKETIFYKKDCNFEYRNSIFKNINNIFLITKVCYSFPTKNTFCTNYPELLNKLENKILNSQLIYNTIVEIRNNKLPDINKYPNAGSFFKNPIVSYEQFNVLQKKHPNIKYFNTKNEIKISAAWLIEQCNWKKKQTGKVSVYEKHSLIIINKKNATGQDIYNFSKKIVDSVYKKFNIILEPEIVLL